MTRVSVETGNIQGNGRTQSGELSADGFGADGFTGAAGELRVVDFGNGYQGVYLDTTGDKNPDSIIVVLSDHALAEADFVL